jgi:prevent-host-death family protein
MPTFYSAMLSQLWTVCPPSSWATLTIFSDHVTLIRMEAIPISKFKATCLAVMQRVKRTGRPVLVTRFGQPVAEVIPPRPRPSDSGWIGSMEGRVVIVGDIVGPAVDETEWEALRP